MATLKDSLDFFDRLKIVSGVYGKKCIKNSFLFSDTTRLILVLKEGKGIVRISFKTYVSKIFWSNVIFAWCVEAKYTSGYAPKICRFVMRFCSKTFLS